MTFEEVKTFLSQCEREELVDRSFGDAEVYWTLNGEEVAVGYFARGTSSVGSSDFVNDPPEKVAKRWKFEGKEADLLRGLGTDG